MFRFSIRELMLLTALAATVVSLWICRCNDAVARKELARKMFARAPILGPLVPVASAEALDPPSDDEVVRAWEKEKANAVQGGIPVLREIEHNNVRIVKEKIADYIDPPRVVPLIGPVQLHHVHYKCTIYCTEVIRVGWPIQHTEQEDIQEVIYIDHNRFHMVEQVSSVVPISSPPASSPTP